MKYKKAEFDLQSFMVTVVLFMGIMVTFGMFAVNMGNNYNSLTGNTVDSSFTDTYDQLKEIEGETQDVQKEVGLTDTGSQDAGSEFLGDALNSLKLILPSLRTSAVMMDSMSRVIGFDSYWFRVLSLVLIIMLLTVVIFMIFRYR